MLLWNTNNKMAAPAPVQLQRPVTVSDLVCCVFVYVPESVIFLHCNYTCGFLKSFPFSEKEFSLSEMKHFLGSDVRIFTGLIRVDKIILHIN